MTTHTLMLAMTHRVVFIPHNGQAKRQFLPPEPEPRLRPAVVCPVNSCPRLWCKQCERLVHPAEARCCGSQWCKAKLDLAESEARG